MESQKLLHQIDFELKIETNELMYCNRYVIDKELISFDQRFRFKLNRLFVVHTYHFLIITIWEKKTRKKVATAVPILGIQRKK